MTSSSSQPKVAVIGGGTGSFTILSGLKNYTPNITALVNMSDDGGSTGVLRDELGVLPPGDVRQCLVALSETQRVRDLFSYRFDEGSLKGHSFGNLFLSAVEKMTHSFEEAIETASEVLRITGRVLPITLDDVQLVMTEQTGKQVHGEHSIGKAKFEKARPNFVLEPQASLNPKAREALLDADVIVIAPGNLYASLAPALIVDGVRHALKKSNAKIVYVCNLVTKPGQTDEFLVHDYAAEIERFVGANVLDYVLFNTDEPTPSMLRKYTHDGEYSIEFDLDKLGSMHYVAIGLPLIDKRPVEHDPNDKLGRTTRTLIRHNSDAVAREIMKIFFT